MFEKSRRFRYSSFFFFFFFFFSPFAGKVGTSRYFERKVRKGKGVLNKRVVENDRPTTKDDRHSIKQVQLVPP